MNGSKNLDIRTYAAAHNVRLYEVAKKLKMSPSSFSTAYMRTEQSRTTKESLKRIIREIVTEREMEHENEAQEIQA